MNVYMIREDGVDFCIKAETMSTALAICFESYMDDMREEKGYEFDRAGEYKYYHQDIVQSCSLVGELKN